MKWHNIILALPLILTIACKDSITDSKEDIGIINLDKTSYFQDEPATLTIDNTLGFDLRLLGCGSQPGFDIEKEVDGIFKEPYGIDCAGGFPYLIKAGETFEYQINLPLFTQYIDQVEGTYRLKLWLQKLENGDYVYLVDSLRTTRPFTIKSE